jgi:AcrR family transcriptional regulator
VGGPFRGSLDETNGRAKSTTVSKGEATRQTILGHAMRLASHIGLEGLSIGKLAEDLDLSKSGLFAHFRSKQNLQIQVIEAAKAQFVAEVIVPAIQKPRGEPRIKAFFEQWILWGARPGGCLFVSASFELDDQPGPARDALVQAQRDWLDALATGARIAVEEGHFKKGLDPEQFAFELYSLMLGCHHFTRFMKDPKGLRRTRRAFEALLASAR